MARALYRKYRSKTLDEVVGQEHITTTLKNALKNKTFSHAYLFTGPKGVGKTSIARILAHEINELPYDETATHLDIIEIDAASNRRIDEIRDLREKVHIAPTSAKFKVYIIDEVHMLTKEAFNALLKTLEEPPAHVIFILATTEAHKLPETIVSRTQHFTFRSIDNDEVARHLLEIAKQEGIKLADDAASLIAHHGKGSFRDSISLLDQLRSTTTAISVDEVRRALGIAPHDIIVQILNNIDGGDVQSLLTILESCRQHGYGASQLARQIAEAVRERLHASASQQDLRLLKQLLEVSTSHDPEMLLEIILVGAQLESNPRSATASKQPSVTKKTEVTDEPTIPVEQQRVEAPEPPQPILEDIAPKVPKVADIPITSSDEDFSQTAWLQVLEAVKKMHNTLYSVTRMAVPILQGDKLILVFSFPFHYKRLSEAKNSQTIATVVSDILGKPTSVECQMKAENNARPTTPVIPTQNLDTISNIFGGAEVLES